MVLAGVFIGLFKQGDALSFLLVGPSLHVCGALSFWRRKFLNTNHSIHLVLFAKFRAHSFKIETSIHCTPFHDHDAAISVICMFLLWCLNCKMCNVYHVRQFVVITKLRWEALHIVSSLQLTSCMGALLPGFLQRFMCSTFCIWCCCFAALTFIILANTLSAGFASAHRFCSSMVSSCWETLWNSEKQVSSFLIHSNREFLHKATLYVAHSKRCKCPLLECVVFRLCNCPSPKVHLEQHRTHRNRFPST